LKIIICFHSKDAVFGFQNIFKTFENGLAWGNTQSVLKISRLLKKLKGNQFLTVCCDVKDNCESNTYPYDEFKD
jgi:hypothetical protein